MARGMQWEHVAGRLLCINHNWGTGRWHIIFTPRILYVPWCLIVLLASLSTFITQVITLDWVQPSSSSLYGSDLSPNFNILTYLHPLALHHNPEASPVSTEPTAPKVYPTSNWASTRQPSPK